MPCARISRRVALTRALISAGCWGGFKPPRPLAADLLQVPNVTGLYSVRVARIAVPTSTSEASTQMAGWTGRVAVGGGR